MSSEGKTHLLRTVNHLSSTSSGVTEQFEDKPGVPEQFEDRAMRKPQNTSLQPECFKSAQQRHSETTAIDLVH